MLSADAQVEDIGDLSAVMLLEVMLLLRGPAAAGMTLADCKHVTVSFMAGVCLVRRGPGALWRSAHMRSAQYCAS